jgi:hypothetical protein
LRRAIDRGIPYFADANDTMGDLLVWFASDCPDDKLRKVGRWQLNRWRRTAGSYARAGAALTWLSKFGRGATVNKNNEFIAYEGRVSDLGPERAESFPEQSMLAAST